ncbi:MAG: acylphosphatase [Agathobacter sp.]|nr:acylphosphatase [Agathobacter sp.]
MIIHGRVQGVGFRYRARYAAQGLRVTGWVRNEWDGTVEMEAQGTVEQINEMLRVINSGTYISMEGIDSREIPVDMEERGFHVR